MNHPTCLRLLAAALIGCTAFSPPAFADDAKPLYTKDEMAKLKAACDANHDNCTEYAKAEQERREHHEEM